jgi:hypothetical protein
MLRAGQPLEFEDDEKINGPIKLNRNFGNLKVFCFDSNN